MFSVVKKHKIIVILLILLLIISVVKIWSGRQISNAPPVPLPTLQKAVSPDIPQNIDLDFEKQLPDFPQAMDVLKVSQPSVFSLGEIKKLTAVFGFSDEPQVSTASDTGTFYNWATPEKYLAIGGRPELLSFGFADFKTASGSAAPPANLAIEKAKEFLKTNGLDNSLLNLKNPIVENYSTQILKISFTYRVNSFPLLNNAPESPPVSFWFGPSLEILKMTFVNYPQKFEKIKEGIVLPKKEIERRLKNHEETVVYVLAENDRSAESIPNYQLNAAQIKKAYPAYYYPPVTDENNLIVQPILVFETEAVDQLTGRTVAAILYLPATQ